jgi:hypothetical protein
MGQARPITTLDKVAREFAKRTGMALHINTLRAAPMNLASSAIKEYAGCGSPRSRPNNSVRIYTDAHRCSEPSSLSDFPGQYEIITALNESWISHE